MSVYFLNFVQLFENHISIRIACPIVLANTYPMDSVEMALKWERFCTRVGIHVYAGCPGVMAVR